MEHRLAVAAVLTELLEVLAHQEPPVGGDDDVAWPYLAALTDAVRYLIGEDASVPLER
jgi:hypothetical protein